MRLVSPAVACAREYNGAVQSPRNSERNRLMSQSNLMDQPAARLSSSNGNFSGDFEFHSLLSGARRANRQNIGELLEHYRNYLALLATTQIQRRLQPRVSPSDVVQEAMLR